MKSNLLSYPTVLLAPARDPRPPVPLSPISCRPLVDPPYMHVPSSSSDRLASASCPRTTTANFQLQLQPHPHPPLPTIQQSPPRSLPSFRSAVAVPSRALAFPFPAPSACRLRRPVQFACAPLLPLPFRSAVVPTTKCSHPVSLSCCHSSFGSPVRLGRSLSPVPCQPARHSRCFPFL
ncbi:hypothetical protein CALCODRAFT_371775 [Calocera cornea HHB12733]|uniref:Uncharacterized protein n=1 Tax=Calocera cornea HHB12733 TaxID=1353952 RepID=A0A165EHL9_9BASI|nr:hypothetical protein CALCODRAFT_371775 [Calocera cornea HHB12733]